MRLFNVCSVSLSDVNHDALSRPVSGSVSHSQTVKLAIEEAQANISELGRVGLSLAKLGPMVNAAGEVGRVIQSESRKLARHLGLLVDLDSKLKVSSDQLKFLKAEGKKPSCLSQSRLSRSESVAYSTLLVEHDGEMTRQLLAQHAVLMSNTKVGLEFLNSVADEYSSRSSDRES